MNIVERTIELPSGVSLEATIVTRRSVTEVHCSQPKFYKLAILCHPWSRLGGRKEDPVLKELVGPLLEYEYYVVLFNSRGVGKSTKWPSLSALSEAEDLRELVQVLVQELAQAQSYIEQVVLAGYSHGSIPVSHHPVLIQSPHTRPIKVAHLLLSYPLSPLALLTAFHHQNHRAALQKLASDSKANVLVIYGDRDDFTSVRNYRVWAEGLTEKGGRVRVDEVAEGSHFWYGRPMETLLDIVRKWLNTLCDDDDDDDA